ncbi:MAG: nucleotidyltransferase domain-containing protein [Anaerolineales bacterium]
MKELKEGLAKIYGDRFKAVYLYGSYARGDYRDGSDVDVMILLKGFRNYWKEYLRASDYVGDISLKYDVTVSYILLKDVQWQRADIPVVRNIHKDGVSA